MPESAPAAGEALHQRLRALAGAAAAGDAEAFAASVEEVYDLAEAAGPNQRVRALAALARALDDPGLGQGAAADLATVAHALIVLGTPAPAAGPALLRRLADAGEDALRFQRLWTRIAGGVPPDQERVTRAVERRLAEVVGGPMAASATMAWWTIRRFAAAAAAALADAGVRAQLRREPHLHARLVRVARQLAPALDEIADVHSALRITGAPAAHGTAPPSPRPCADLPPPPAGAGPAGAWGPSWKQPPAAPHRRWDGYPERGAGSP